MPEAAGTSNASTRPTYPRVHAERCTCCGVRLTRPGYDVPLIGVVGPRCVLKFGELAVLLETINAARLPLHGDAPMRRAAYGLANTLYHLGFRDVHWIDHGDGSKGLDLGTRTRIARPLFQTWEARRAEFERELKVASGLNAQQVAA